MTHLRAVGARRSGLGGAAAFLVALLLAAPAAAAVIQTRWVEKQPFSSGRGAITVYVRRIEITRTTWKAYVGLHNSANGPVRISVERVAVGRVFSYLAGPGIWYQRLEGNVPTTHAVAATSVAPRYPTSLAPGKSWFGVFTGPTARLPRDRLLRVGFGIVQLEGDAMIAGRSVVPRRTNLSTTHQFRLPKRF